MRYEGIAHLEPKAQAEALREGASLVMKSRFQDCTISLYKADDVMVEVWYNRNEVVKDIKALQLERLTPLLKHFAATCLN